MAQFRLQIFVLEIELSRHSDVPCADRPAPDVVREQKTLAPASLSTAPEFPAEIDGISDAAVRAQRYSSFRTGFRYGSLVMPPIAVYLWPAALI